MIHPNVGQLGTLSFKDEALLKGGEVMPQNFRCSFRLMRECTIMCLFHSICLGLMYVLRLVLVLSFSE